MFEKPDISVVMPVYNDEKYIAEAIDSILNQTFRNLELIIVNDGSTDGSTAIIDGYQKLDPRVKVLRNPAPTGRSAARNAGVAVARGNYLIFHDADDASEPDRLEKQSAYLNGHPEAGVVFSSWTTIDTKGIKIIEERVQKEEPAEMLKDYCAFHHCAAMFRTKNVREIGGYRTAFFIAEDYDMLLRLTEKTKTGTLDSLVYRYRKLPSGISVSQPELGQTSMALARQFALQRALKGHDDYDQYAAAGKIPRATGNSGTARESTYQFLLARNALRCGAYGTCLSRASRGFAANPLLVHKLLLYSAGCALHAFLKITRLLRPVERLFCTAQRILWRNRCKPT